VYSRRSSGVGNERGTLNGLVRFADPYAKGVSGVQQTFAYARDPNTELITGVTDALSRQFSYGYDTNGNLYVGGERVKDVTVHPPFRGLVATLASLYNPQHSFVGRRH
jgi:hypothetical protein